MEPTMDNFLLLGNAVVEQAAWDYRLALCKLQDAYGTGKEYEIKKWQDAVRTLAKFFTGTGIQSYSTINGRALFEKLTREVEAYKYDLDALKADIQERKWGPKGGKF
jgi:cobalamin biosynthesis Co2+ chelatase CbiK